MRNVVWLMKIMLMSRFCVHRHDPASTVAEKCVTNPIYVSLIREMALGMIYSFTKETLFIFLLIVNSASLLHTDQNIIIYVFHI